MISRRAVENAHTEETPRVADIHARKTCKQASTRCEQHEELTAQRTATATTTYTKACTQDGFLALLELVFGLCVTARHVECGGCQGRLPAGALRVPLLSLKRREGVRC